MTHNPAIQSVIDRSKDDLEEIIGEYITIQRKGSSLKACCPFHDEKTPSLSISPAKGIWKCFGCGAGISTIDFIMQYENIEFMDAIKKLAKRYGIDINQSKGNKSRVAHNSKKNTLTPGLSNQKAIIRKNQSITIILNPNKSAVSNNEGVLIWKAPIIELQAKALLKLATDLHINLIVDGITIDDVINSICAIYKHDLPLNKYVQLKISFNNKKYQPTDFLLSQITDAEQSHNAIIKCLSCIKDSLLRSLHIKYYTNKLEESSTTQPTETLIQ